MKMNSTVRLSALPIAALILMIASSGCTPFSANETQTAIKVDQVLRVPAKESIVAGNGEKYRGKGALSVPTTEAVVARIQNGLQKNVMATTGNFGKALTQLKSNLPKVSDPLKATGYDQIQLLVYAACSDLTTGGTPMMKTKYNVDPVASIATNNSALISAGTKILDQYTASLASQGPTSIRVNQVLVDLIQQLSGNSANTSTVAFMSVCMAANTTGVTLLGF